MDKMEYIREVKQQFENEAKRKNLLPGSSINMDWGELQLILTIATDTLASPSTNKINVEESDSCYLCGNETTIIRAEQYAILENDLRKKKCLDCLIAQLQNNKIETDQLYSYWSFVREMDLEEEFDYFMLEQLEMSN